MMVRRVAQSLQVISSYFVLFAACETQNWIRTLNLHVGNVPSQGTSFF